jgi:hypothetical protein
MDLNSSRERFQPACFGGRRRVVLRGSEGNGVEVRDEQREPGRRREVGNAVIGGLAAALESGGKEYKK